MQCPRCKNQIVAVEKFCPFCGFLLKQPSTVVSDQPSSWSSQQERQAPFASSPPSHLMDAAFSPFMSPAPSNGFSSSPEPETPFQNFHSANGNGFARSTRIEQQSVPAFNAAPFLPGASSMSRPALNSPNLDNMEMESTSTIPSDDFPSSPSTVNASSLNLFSPGDVLYGNSYRLRAQLDYQNWGEGVYEISWSASALNMREAPVTISEVMVPGRSSSTQSILRPAMRTLFTVNEYQYGPKLLDVFLDRGRTFFVFSTIEGESMLARAKRSGSLQEKSVVDCCLSVLDILDAFAQRSLVHGMISPEHIVVPSGNSTLAYRLTNVSIVVASGAYQFIRGMDPASLSAYMAPEIVQGEVNATTDLYGLMASAYHLVTGRIPVSVSGSIPLAQQVNPTVTPAFSSVLARALHPQVRQRYQSVADLRRALLDQAASGPALDSTSGGEWMRPLSTNSSTNSADPWDLPFAQNPPLPPLSNPEPPSFQTPLPPLQREPSSQPPLPPLQRELPSQPSLPPRPRNTTFQPSSSSAQNSGSSIPGSPRPSAMRQQAPVARKQPGFLQASNPSLRSFSPQQSVTRTASSTNMQPTLQFLPSVDDEEPSVNLLPNPEELPPISQGNDTLAAYSWVTLIVLALLILTFIAR